MLFEKVGKNNDVCIGDLREEIFSELDKVSSVDSSEYDDWMDKLSGLVSLALDHLEHRSIWLELATLQLKNSLTLDTVPIDLHIERLIEVENQTSIYESGWQQDPASYDGPLPEDQTSKGTKLTY